MKAGFLCVSIAMLSGCVSQQAVDAERHFQATLPTCNTDKDCERKWSMARNWMLNTMAMKLQHYAPDYMETYNPTEGYGGRVTKDPIDHVTYRISLALSCAGLACFTSLGPVKQSFNDYLNGTISTPPPALPRPRGPAGNPTRR